MIFELLGAIAVVVGLIAVNQLSKRKKYETTVLIVSAAMYTAGVIYLTMFRGDRGSISGMNFKFPLPFWTALRDLHYGLATNRSVLNLLMFVPFGYLFSGLLSLRNGTVRWWIVFITGFAATLLIESLQLWLHRGVFELDDLVKNTMGAVAGYAVWRWLNRGKKLHDNK